MLLRSLVTIPTYVLVPRSSPTRLNLTSQWHWLDVMVTAPQRADISLVVHSLRYMSREHTHKPTIISEVQQGCVASGAAAMFDHKFSFLVRCGYVWLCV